MLSLLKRIFIGCEHKWVEDSRANIVRSRDKSRVGEASFCHCEKCGVRKVFEMVV